MADNRSIRVRGTCTIDGCNRVLKGRGRCSMHRMQLRAIEEPLYQKWVSMRKRCNSPSQRSYKNYGARGIKVCERWSSFNAYKADIAKLGPPPTPKHSIDRIDNDGDYEPGNVRWASPLEQAANKALLRSSNKSGYPGVNRKNYKYERWTSRITVSGKRIFLGDFKSKQEAIDARKAAERKCYGR